MTPTTTSGRRALDDSRARFERRARLARRRSWRLWLASLATLAITAGAVWLLAFSSLLAVADVSVDGVGGDEATAVRDLVTKATGTPLTRVDTARLAAEVRGRAVIADATVERSWPRTLVVHVTLRTPAIVLQNPNGQLEVVDKDGVGYTTTAERIPGVPIVSAANTYAVSRDSLTAALSIVRALPPELSAQVGDMTVTSADLVTFTLGRTTVVWGGAADAALKVRIIEAVIDSKPSRIDVSAPQTPVTR